MISCNESSSVGVKKLRIKNSGQFNIYRFYFSRVRQEMVRIFWFMKLYGEEMCMFAVLESANGRWTLTLDPVYAEDAAVCAAYWTTATPFGVRTHKDRQHIADLLLSRVGAYPTIFIVHAETILRCFLG